MQRLTVSLFAVVLLAGCVTTSGTPDERRGAIREMRTDVLNQLYTRKASARAELAAAPGYGVFSNANINVILASFGGGYGVIRDNQTGADTYMKMGEVGVGLGAGVKDYRLVFVFHDAETMNDFVETGISFGGQADAAAKAGDQGAAVGGEAVLDGVTVYQITESGLALQATVKGTKYWKDESLN
ncbi:MAG: YSC84-related protein [Pseudomonadota bacterium]